MMNILGLSVLFLPYSEAFRIGLNSLQRSKLFPLRMSDISWTQSKVVKNEKNAEGLRFIEMEIPENLIGSYTVPGQYIQIRTSAEAKPGFYALASPPQYNFFSFLVKETENNALLTKSEIGTQFQISAPMGKGFLFQEYFDKYKFEFPTTEVFLMCTGSGIAPIAAAIDSDLLGFNTVAYNSLIARQGLLYIGAKTTSHLPFSERYKDWEAKGIKIIPVLSQPVAGWTGRTGYVQDALRKDKVKTPRNAGALLCGQRAMADSVKEILLDSGVFEGRILLNF